MPTTDCAAIVLAAGGSTRLGQPKQLIRLQGETLLRRTVRLVCEAGCSPVFAVLGQNAETLSRELEGLAATTVLNRDWQSGMASSLQAGIQAMLGLNPQQQNTMVLVCDQPMLTLAVLLDLLKTHQLEQRKITASSYDGVLGVPAIFSNDIFGELLQLTGDQGARRILQSTPGRVASVEFPGGGFDLDTPADLAKLKA